MSNDSFLRPVQDFNPASASYSSGQVLTHTQLNTDNDYETTALGIISEIIGDIEGSNTTYRSPAFINALGRAIGSMGLLNPVFSEDWTEVQTLCTTGVVYGPFAISDNVTKIVLDFIPTAAPTIAGYSAVTARESLATAMFYWSASNRTLEFYDALTSAITVQYDPGATAPAYPSSYFEGDGFNVIPSLPDIADSGVGATVTGVSPNYEIDFSSITTGEPTNIADLTNVNSYSTRLAFTAFTSNPKYYVPKFIRDAANLKTGGGLNLTGITFNLPTNAVSLFEINGTVVGNKINANFTFTYNIADDDKIYVGGDAVALAVLEELKTSQQKLAVVFTQGESLAQIASYTKSMLLQHNHGADGGQPISALDLIDVKPGGMGSSSMSDGTIPMNWAPQYLHRGGFTDTAPNIDGNAFIGDLRLSNGAGTNTTLLSSYSPGTPLSLYLNSLSTDWATLTGGAKVGKLSSINGGNLDYALFGNGYSIFDDRVTVGPNGILDVVGLVSDSVVAISSIHGINFFNDSANPVSTFSTVNKNILGQSRDVAQLAGTFNFSMDNARRTGFRRRVIHGNSQSYGSVLYFGADYLDAPIGVKDFAAIGWRWTSNGIGTPEASSFWLSANNSIFDESNNADPWDIGQIGINITDGIYFYPNRGDITSSTSGQRQSGIRLVINPDTSNNSVILRPIQNGTEDGSKDFLFSDARDSWSFDDDLHIGGGLIVDGNITPSGLFRTGWHSGQIAGSNNQNLGNPVTESHFIYLDGIGNPGLSTTNRFIVGIETDEDTGESNNALSFKVAVATSGPNENRYYFKVSNPLQITVDYKVRFVVWTID